MKRQARESSTAQSRFSWTTPGVSRATHLHRLGAPTAALLVLALVSLGLTACGGGGDGGNSTQSGHAGPGPEDARQFGSEVTGKQARQIEAVVSGYFEARSAGEWQAACAAIAKPKRQLLGTLATSSKQIDGEGCAAYLAYLGKQLPSSERAALAEAEIESVRVDGAQGYALYREAGGAERAMPVTRESGDWKVASATARDFS